MTNATHTTAPAADLNAAYDFISALAPRSDSAIGPSLLWGGWALRDAFLAGIARERASHDGLVEALREARDFIAADRRELVQSVTTPPDHDIATAEPDDLDFITEYDKLLAKIDRALEAAGITEAIE